MSAAGAGSVSMANPLRPPHVLRAITRGHFRCSTYPVAFQSWQHWRTRSTAQTRQRQQDIERTADVAHDIFQQRDDHCTVDLVVSASGISKYVFAKPGAVMASRTLPSRSSAWI